MADVAALAKEFGARPENSARSVLVTILGDSIVPLGGQVWLGELISLMQPFGFSERLVRTSVYRLVAESLLESHRVGRRSRYRLTEHARSEFALADGRIYHAPVVDWTEEWTLVFYEFVTSTEQRALLGQRLRWAGFVRLATGVRGRPGDGRGLVADIEERMELVEPLPIATARFDDLAVLARSETLREEFGLAEARARYLDFIERYSDLGAMAGVAGRDAFVLRTMLVHDLRRAALVDPLVPIDLLPADWPSGTAREIAGGLYRSLDKEAWMWLHEVTGLAADSPDRFVAG